jgi:hypothetical protein
MTDGKFLAVIRRVSQNDTVYFTRNQLYTSYCRSQQKGYRGVLLCGLALALGAVACLMLSRELTVLAMVLGLGTLICVGIAVFRRFRPPPSPNTLQAYLSRWRGAGHTIDKLLTQPSLHTPPPEWQEPDIYDYGVERFLLVEHDLLVDLLVRNGLHAQERVLILSEGGYPAYLLPVAERCLQDNPQLPVYLLHDATRQGATMATRLQISTLLPLAGHPLLDLGLFSHDVKRLHRLRALKPQRRDFALPVDCLPMAVLGAGVTQAMAANLAFSDILLHTHRRDPSGGADGGFG